MKDLIFVVADKNMHFALRGAMNRPKALGIRPISVDYLVHSGRDGGVRKTGPDLLSSKRSAAHHGVVMLDFEGCGAVTSPHELERELTRRTASVWGDRGAALVIEPELDAWMWGAEATLKTTLGWRDPGSIRDWLREQGFGFDAHEKPERPKEALESVLRKLRTPRSSAIYEELAGRLSLSRCVDPAFVRLRTTLQRWFPAT